MPESIQKQFLNYIYEKNDAYKELYVVLFFTGMRISEVAALCMEDIDFENGFIHIQRAVKFLKGEVYIDKPKRDPVGLFRCFRLWKKQN